MSRKPNTPYDRHISRRMAADHELIEKAWDYVSCWYSEGNYHLRFGGRYIIYKAEPTLWAAAAKFTIEVQEKIEELRRDLKWALRNEAPPSLIKRLEVELSNSSVGLRKVSTDEI